MLDKPGTDRAHGIERRPRCEGTNLVRRRAEGHGREEDDGNENNKDMKNR